MRSTIYNLRSSINRHKALFNVLFAFCLSVQIQAQDKPIKTETVIIENLIPFIIETYANVSDSQHITLLIETTKNTFTDEETFFLKQSVKYLSEKLSNDDTISIAAYNALNGLALEQASIEDFKKITKVISSLSKYVDKDENDGITATYQYVKDVLEEDVVNTIIMVRNPNGTKNESSYSVNASSIQDTATKKQNGNMVLLTAIAVLPELLSIIKD